MRCCAVADLRNIFFLGLNVRIHTYVVGLGSATGLNLGLQDADEAISLRNGYSQVCLQLRPT